MLKNKVVSAFVLAGMLTICAAGTSFAGQWVRDGVNWSYVEDSGSSPDQGWHWIDSDGDGIAECYYFVGYNGHILMDDWVDGYYVNGDGMWAEGGEVQHKDLNQAQAAQEAQAAQAQAAQAQAQAQSAQAKLPTGNFYLNGEYTLTMPEDYSDGYYHSLVIMDAGVDGYYFSHVTSRHPGSTYITSIPAGTAVKYTQSYKGSPAESGTLLFDGTDTMYLQVDGADEVLTFIRR